MNKQKNKKAFTLVELIVVITILAILATIAFLSFQSYMKNARDGNRITTLNNIDKGLNIYKTQKGKYPMPDNINGTGTLNGKELVYVGEIGKNIQRLINLNSLPKDPLTNDEFFYGISKDAENYQLAAIYETELSQNVVTSTYADSGYKAKVLGNYEGILKYNSGGICISNVPSLLFATGGQIDLKNENVGFIVNKGENLPYKSLKSKAILKPTTDILKMISNTGSVTTECKTEEEWKDAFLEEQKKQELETKFGYEIDKTGKQIFGDKYFKEIKKEEGLSLSSDLYSLSDDELKNIFVSKNIFTNNWENTSLCNVSSMKIDSTTFHPGTFNQDLTFTGNTIYKIPAGEYIFSKANVDESYFTKYGSNCVGFIGEGENKTIIKNADSGDSIFLVDGGNNIILSGFSVNRDDPVQKIIGIHIKSSSNNTTLTNIEVKNQDVGIWSEGNTNIGFLSFNNNETGIRHTSGNINIKSTTSSGNVRDGIDIYGGSNHVIEDSYFNNNGPSDDDNGSGIFHSSGNLTIKNSYFNNNSTGIASVNGNLIVKNVTADGNLNRGFSNNGGENHIIEDSHFDNNGWGFSSTEGNLTIRNITVNGNSKDGGFSNNGGENHIIENSEFKNNIGFSGFNSTKGNLTIKNIVVSGNLGWGFNNNGGENHIIEDSHFDDNNGFGLYSSVGNLTIKNITANGNSNRGLNNHGGTNHLIENSHFDNNNSYGLYNTSGNLVIRSSYFNGNKEVGLNSSNSPLELETVTLENNLSKGLELYGGEKKLTNVISNNNGGDGIYMLGGEDSNNILNNVTSTNNVGNGLFMSGNGTQINNLKVNSNSQNGLSINWGENNIINTVEAKNNNLHGILIEQYGNNNTISNYTNLGNISGAILNKGTGNSINP